MSQDFVFHWDGAEGTEWDSLRVVSFELTDAISQPYALRLLVVAPAADADLDPYDLIGKLGTLRIATGAEPAVRSVHGLVVEAEDKGLGQHGALYELLLAPPFSRATHSEKSRIFLDKSLKQIVETVLKEAARTEPGQTSSETPDTLTDSFAVPKAHYELRLSDTARFEDKKARPYVVQYQESDFTFLSRLLEDEGISYHFEHDKDAVVMVMSDSDSGKLKLEPADALSPLLAGRHLDQMRFGGKLRPSKVKLVDYNWQKPKLAMHAEAESDGDSELSVERYPGGFTDSPELGAPLAKVQLERLATEARTATAAGSVRLLGAGSIFAFEHQVARFAGEYLTVRARLRGQAEGALGAGSGGMQALPGGVPMYTEVELVRRGSHDKVEESRFRPARASKRPRIIGPQTAMVVAEPSNRDAEIHVGGPEGNENGCVRLQFHWDTETARLDKEPASAWVRVSQVFAGAGGGAVFHPRVGTEVIVEFEEGDPDRPIITGRVYNGIQPAAAIGKGAATVSTLKSLASPGGKVFNELQFNDTAGEEKVNLTAGKDWNSNVGNDRNETITTNSKSEVGADRTESTGGNRKTDVSGNNEEGIGGDEKVTVGGSQKVDVSSAQTMIVGAGQDISVGASRNLSVGASQGVSISAANSVLVGAAETYTIGATQDVIVGAAKSELIGATYSLTVAAAMTETVGGPHVRSSPVDVTNAPTHQINSATTAVNAAATITLSAPVIQALAAGEATLQGATVSVTAGGDLVLSGASIQIKGGAVSIEGGSVKIAGGSVDITGGLVKVN